MRYARFNFVLLCCLTVAAGPQASRWTAISPRTEAAVVAADAAWSKAEDEGDVVFLDDLLAPDYQSIAPDGKSTGKAQILEAARKHTALAPEERKAIVAQNAAWAALHIGTNRVVISGETAVLTRVSGMAGKEGRVASCDVFAYRDGRWHALYSQHTSV